MKPRLVGSYLLLLELECDTIMSVGKLGEIPFKKGRYAYAGSAKNSLVPRVRRHFSRDKIIHWHIDYLMEKGKPLYAIIFEDEAETECSLNEFISSLPDSIQVNGFGCSDCDCKSHLHWIGENSLKEIESEFQGRGRLFPKDVQ